VKVTREYYPCEPYPIKWLN